MGGEKPQGVLHRVGEQHGRQVPGVVRGIVDAQPVGSEESQVETDVVAHYRVFAYKLLHLRGDGAEERGAGNLAGRDVGQALDELGDVPARIDEGLEGVDYLFALELDCADLNDGVSVLVQAGGFQIQRDADLLKR